MYCLVAIISLIVIILGVNFFRASKQKAIRNKRKYSPRRVAGPKYSTRRVIDPKNLTTNLGLITEIVETTKGNGDKFAETLRRRKIPHISFSKITTVEFCEYRYYLQYVKMIDPIPTPEYFTKGKIVHELIAKNYLQVAQNQEISLAKNIQSLKRKYEGKDLNHLVNAMTVHLDNFWHDHEIVAVEEPFAMIIDEKLPPCVGVIDLILKKGESIIVVDHKTGRDFYPKDELQMAIYVKYISQKYRSQQCEFFYDNYRWVNNLNRIRKPAFQRIPVSLSASTWDSSLNRLRGGYQRIRHIKKTIDAFPNGNCYLCPYRTYCRINGIESMSMRGNYW